MESVDRLAGARVLVLGGSRFVGPCVVQQLVSSGARVTVLNRGVTTPSQDCSQDVTRVRCDRYSAEFGRYIQQAGRWDLVLDFIAYQSCHLDPLLVTPGQIGHYIVISSDSVYMASDPAKLVRNQGGRVLEQSAVRPQDQRLAQARHAGDEYGSGKLGVEERLKAQGDRSGLQWTVLRLADVCGPNDNTGRLSEVLQSVASHRPVGGCVASHNDNPTWRIADGATHKISLVFSEDVASACLQAFRAGSCCYRYNQCYIHTCCAGAEGVVYRRAYNIASVETPTWHELVRMLATELGALSELGLKTVRPRAIHWACICGRWSTEREQRHERHGLAANAHGIVASKIGGLVSAE